MPRIMTYVIFLVGPGLYILHLLNYNPPIVETQHPLTSLQMQLPAENNKMCVKSLPSAIYFAILLCPKWRVSFLQKDTLSPPSSAVDLVNMEESSSRNMEIDNNVAASPKSGRSVKAGEATPDAIKSWKENGFSRFLHILHSESLKIFCLVSLFGWYFYFQFDYCCSKHGCLGHCKRTCATSSILSAVCDISPVSPGNRFYKQNTPHILRTSILCFVAIYLILIFSDWYPWI